MTTTSIKAKVESQHTPGPWQHNVNTSAAARFVEVLGEGWAIAHVYGDAKSAETQANARLIAAAPDLLAACKRSLSWLSSYPGNGAEAVFDQASAAIAKAEGQ